MAKPYLEEYIPINGIQHYLLHYPAPNPQCPVVLFLHGGPGSSEANFSYLFRQWWGDEMSLVQYDQRGAGKTLNKNPDYTAYDVTQEAMLADLAEIIDYLCARYGKEKIVLMGHSWGTVLGADFALKHPQRVAMYIAVGQVVDMRRNEQLGFEKALELAKNAGNERDVKRLEAIRPYPIERMSSQEGLRKLTAVRKMQQKYNVAIRMPLSLVRAFIKSPAFVFSDLTTMLFKAGKVNLPLMDTLMDFDLGTREASFQMPVCCIQGDRDYQTVTSEAVAFFEKAQAPAKQIHVLPDAGHASMMDQPRLFAEALHQALALLG